jgi:hypothetical protein
MAFQQNAFQQNAFQVGANAPSAQAPFTNANHIGGDPNTPETPRIGVAWIAPNLVISTLALFAAASQDVKREAVVNPIKPAPQVQVFQPPNLLTSTLGAAPPALPFVSEQTASAPQTPRHPTQFQPNNLVINGPGVQPIPIGQQECQSAPVSVAIGVTWDRTTNTLLLSARTANDQTASAPRTPEIAPASQQSNLLTSTLAALAPLPFVNDQCASAPFALSALGVFQPPNLVLYAPQPLPVGTQEIASAPLSTAAGQTFDESRNLLLLVDVVVSPLPVGQQATSSAPPTNRIGSILFARGVDPQPPVVAELPIGQQHTDSAPILKTDVWAQNSAQLPDQIPPPAAPVPLPPGEQRTESAPILKTAVWAQNSSQIPDQIPPWQIASSQSEFSFFIRTPAVFAWQPPNVTINLPVPTALPVGSSQTDNLVQTPAVTAFQPPIILPPIIAAPVGTQHTDSAPFPPPAVVATQQRNLLLSTLAPLPLPVGSQHTDSAPVVNPPVVATQQRNLLLGTLFVPAGPLPIGQQHTDSIAAQVIAVWAQNSSQPPDTIPPPVVVPEPEATQKPAGKSKKRHRDRYIARYKEQLYEFETLADLEQFVLDVTLVEKAKPKKERAPIKIKLEPEFKDEVSEYVDVPRRLESMPTTAAMAQIRRIDQIFERILAKAQADEDDDEETLLWLI